MSSSEIVNVCPGIISHLLPLPLWGKWLVCGLVFLFFFKPLCYMFSLIIIFDS